MSKPNDAGVEALKRIGRYVEGYKRVVCCYPDNARTESMYTVALVVQAASELGNRRVVAASFAAPTSSKLDRLHRRTLRCPAGGGKSTTVLSNPAALGLDTKPCLLIVAPDPRSGFGQAVQPPWGWLHARASARYSTWTRARCGCSKPPGAAGSTDGRSKGLRTRPTCVRNSSRSVDYSVVDAKKARAEAAPEMRGERLPQIKSLFAGIECKHSMRRAHM